MPIKKRSPPRRKRSPQKGGAKLSCQEAHKIIMSNLKSKMEGLRSEKDKLKGDMTSGKKGLSTQYKSVEKKLASVTSKFNKKSKSKRCNIGSAYTRFMKIEMARLRQQNPSMAQKDIMKAAAGNWSKSKK